jgi:hypothetical protein
MAARPGRLGHSGTMRRTEHIVKLENRKSKKVLDS